MRLYREQMPIVMPHTFNSLQKLVMAMADVVKDADKKTWFGRDKGQLAYAYFLRMLRATLQSMVLDKLVRESTTSHDVVNVLEDKLIQFAWRTRTGKTPMGSQQCSSVIKGQTQ